MKAHGGSFCSSWDGGLGKIFGGHLQCVLNIDFGEPLGRVSNLGSAPNGPVLCA